MSKRPKCVYCGGLPESPAHRKYGADIDNPLKHVYDPGPDSESDLDTLLAKLVQVVVERAAQICDSKYGEGDSAHEASYEIRQLSSPENVAEMIKEAKIKSKT